MAIISIIGSKGGTGTSLVATNIASDLSRSEKVVLVDLHVGSGVDDLLLDVNTEKTWDELLPVLDELEPIHIELATREHSSGLKILCGPDRWRQAGKPDKLKRLIQALEGHFDFIVVDLPDGLELVNRAVLSISNAILLVTTADPPALRGAKRFVADLEPENAGRVGLVVNQINRHHPSTSSNIAASLGLPLLAALPPDPRAVGYQIHFGRSCVQDPSSKFGRAIHGLAARLQQSARAQNKSLHLVDQERGIG